MDLFKQILPSLLENNKYQIETEEDEKELVPFVINKGLSAHIDTILYVNEMNLNSFLDKKLQYDYYFHSLRKYKRRYQKWLKYTEEDNIELVKEYYNYSTEKAKQVLSLLTEEQLQFIKDKLHKGGKS